MTIKTPNNRIPFISIVIPAFNEEKYISHCLKALRNQTYPQDKYEIIVSDNNSSDNTVKIARKFNTRIVHAKKQGNTYALEKGCASAKGDIIACTDADSVADHTWVEELAGIFTDKQIVAVTGAATTDFDSPIVRRLTTSLYSVFIRVSFALGIPNLSGFNMAFRQKAYKQIGGVNVHIQMSPDVDLGRRFKKIGKVVYKPNIHVITSSRRWKNGFWKTLWEYTEGYISVNFLHRSPSTKQKVVR